MAVQLPAGAQVASTHLVREVVPRFGFAASEIGAIERVPQQIKNVNYRVHAGGLDWVLKRYPSPRARQELEFAHALQMQLAEHAFPMAPLRTTADGDTVVADETGTYSLHAWVHGQQISIDQRDAAFATRPTMVSELGFTLGTLHRLTSSMALPPVEYVSDPDHLLKAPRRTMTSIRRGRPPHMFQTTFLRLRPDKIDFDRWILEHLPSLYTHARRLAATSVRGRAGDVVVSHHDLNWENLVFDRDFRLLALLDFDNATRVHRDLDVGLAAAALVGSPSERLTEFLAAYTAASGHAVDRSVVCLGIQLRCARSIMWSIAAYLSRRVANEAMLMTWCTHLYACLDDLSAESHRGLSWFALMGPALAEAEGLSYLTVL